MVQNEALEDIAEEEEVPGLAFQSSTHMAEGRTSEEPDHLARDLLQNQYCQNIRRNCAYIREHLNHVRKVAFELVKDHILSEDMYFSIDEICITKGPTCAVEDILEVPFLYFSELIYNSS